VGISIIQPALEIGSKSATLAHVAEKEISEQSRFSARIADGTTMSAREFTCQKWEHS
jgi:hypothetical protein